MRAWGHQYSDKCVQILLFLEEAGSASLLSQDLMRLLCRRAARGRWRGTPGGTYLGSGPPRISSGDWPQHSAGSLNTRPAPTPPSSSGRWSKCYSQTKPFCDSLKHQSKTLPTGCCTAYMDSWWAKTPSLLSRRGFIGSDAIIVL